jgi:GT2 family glycosyltransferase
MNTKVCAVVVTYNRVKLLEKCISSLKNQTRKIERIIVVNNGSTDGTLNWLEKQSEVEVINQENIGGAGGFHTGIKGALDKPCDWIWVMDDDVAPDKNCLIEQLKYQNYSECIHPTKKLENGENYCWEHSMDLASGSRTVLPNISFKNGKEIVYTNVACFEGMLISRRIVEIIGLPDVKYFICEDDTLYGFKASLYTNVSYISSAVIYKLIPLGIQAPWKNFYMLRNKFYLYKDAIDFANIKISKYNKGIFILVQFISLIRQFKYGIKYILPSIRGFNSGIYYMFSKK